MYGDDPSCIDGCDEGCRVKKCERFVVWKEGGDVYIWIRSLRHSVHGQEREMGAVVTSLLRVQQEALAAVLAAYPG